VGLEMTEIKLKDAIKVIKAAKKLGVISMKLGTLEFELSNEPRAARPALKVSKKEIAKQTDRADAQMQFDDAKEDLSVMHVEDPSGFERALIDQELEDDTSVGGEQIEETLGS
jgi:hypothetical protein